MPRDGLEVIREDFPPLLAPRHGGPLPKKGDSTGLGKYSEKVLALV